MSRDTVVDQLVPSMLLFKPSLLPVLWPLFLPNGLQGIATEYKANLQCTQLSSFCLSHKPLRHVPNFSQPRKFYKKQQKFLKTHKSTPPSKQNKNPQKNKKKKKENEKTWREDKSQMCSPSCEPLISRAALRQWQYLFAPIPVSLASQTGLKSWHLVLRISACACLCAYV